MDLGQFLLTVAVTVAGGAGFWAFLSSTRSATSEEYKQFVEDLQQERKDRESAISSLRKELQDERDARLSASEALYTQNLLIADLIVHVGKLEDAVSAAGGSVPKRPSSMNEYILDQVG